jgi:hypothetical protein
MNYCQNDHVQGLDMFLLRVYILQLITHVMILNFIHD